jgi:excinuclease ABC subunit B
MTNFKLKSKYEPSGDQPQAIEKLVKGLEAGMQNQTLLGVTGSGKTFTAANIIAQVQKPTLVIAHNKTLAAQLAQEYQAFFPENAVHYFVSYYDYYQPEAYIAATDTFIEKDMAINEEIERLRHASTQALLSRQDVIIVASVSCIYGLGSPDEYLKQNLKLTVGDKTDRRELMESLVHIHFERTTADLMPGTFRVMGNRFEIMSTAEKVIYLVEIAENSIVGITKIDAISRSILQEVPDVFIFPAKHYVTDETQQKRAVKSIKVELDKRLAELKKEGKLLEAERLKRRTTYDLALIKEIGFCSGIENYSRHFDGRAEGEPPHTLLSYFPHKEDGSPDFLTIVDESHVTIPQIGGMYAGDRSRKKNLIDYGFRLSSAVDNRPLRFEEFRKRVGQMVFTSATPGDYEAEVSGQVVEQIIRPTGLLDPIIDIRPVIEKGDFPGQVKDLIKEIEITTKKGERTLVTTLTKKMAEDLSEFLKAKGIKTQYLHSDIKTMERIQILTEFRKGIFDCLVGVNLLREGLDLPEVSLVGILDADKEGFLRSKTSLIQTIGRAARNDSGRVILYADHITKSIEGAVGETRKRRERQIAYNKANGITPVTIKKVIHDITEQMETVHSKGVSTILSIDKAMIHKNPQKLEILLKQKNKQMNAAAKILDFETAALLRDEIRELEKMLVPEIDKKA